MSPGCFVLHTRGNQACQFFWSVLALRGNRMRQYIDAILPVSLRSRFRLHKHVELAGGKVGMALLGVI